MIQEKGTRVLFFNDEGEVATGVVTTVDASELGGTVVYHVYEEVADRDHVVFGENSLVIDDYVDVNEMAEL